MGRILKGVGAACRLVEAWPGSPQADGGPQADAALLAAARAEAEALLAAARGEAARLREEALAERGRLAAERSHAAEAALAAERERLRAEADGEIVELALAVAARVLACAVEDGRAARESAARALARAREARRLLLRAHPGDAAAVGEAARAAAGRAQVEVRADPEVGRGGVLLECEAGTVDARLESQLAVIGRRLGAAA